MGQLKEKKDIEDMFKKAQKPWAKQFEKVNKARADYHNACKSERSAQNQERNAGGDSSLSPDQVRYSPEMIMIIIILNVLVSDHGGPYYITSRIRDCIGRTQ